MSEPATDLFLSLTPDKVLAAVEAAGLATNPVCYPLNSFENRVYEVELEDRSRVIAKFYRPGRWSRDEILEEHRFLTELADDEIPVCTVRPFPDGETLKQIDHIYYSLSDRRGGRAPDELTDDAVSRLGRLVGRMHNIGVRSDAGSRRPLNAEQYVRRPLAWMQERNVIPEGLSTRYAAAALALADITDEWMEDVPTHRIHADLHHGNILFRDDELRVLDFDDMTTGPAVQDLWLALPGRDPETERQRHLFLEGYEQFRLFDPATLRLIEPLRALRLVRYAGWLARRWHDPAFKAGWSHFGTEDYWRTETEDLEEQLAVLRGERRFSVDLGGIRMPEEQEGDGEEELTNKDFFWDWEGD